MIHSFTAALAAEIVVVIAIIIGAVILVNAGAIGLTIFDWIP